MKLLLKLLLKLREDLFLVDKDYIKKKLEKRRGECKKCGKCCGNCWHLDRKSKLCKVYEGRPFLCYKNFPLDRLDQKVWNVKDCGYKFIS